MRPTSGRIGCHRPARAVPARVQWTGWNPLALLPPWCSHLATMPGSRGEAVREYSSGRLGLNLRDGEPAGADSPATLMRPSGQESEATRESVRPFRNQGGLVQQRVGNFLSGLDSRKDDRPSCTGRRPLGPTRNHLTLSIRSPWATVHYLSLSGHPLLPDGNWTKARRTERTPLVQT